MPITYDDFAKVEMRVGRIAQAEPVPNKDRLLKLQVDFGTEQRQIVAGIRQAFPDPAMLVGGNYLFVTNLEPRVVGGVESNGMILAIKNDAGELALLTPTGHQFVGAKAG